VPAREIFAFTIPLLTSDLVTVLMHSSDALLLGYFCDLKQVAFFRVVLPAAALNHLIMNSFALLYTPAAARLFAKANYGGINDLYWRTAIWMAVLSFPVFAVTFSLAQPLTVFLYGARYAQSGVILALLSLGYYFNVALGFNGLTLKVLGKLRYVVTINLLAAATNVTVNLLLIPRYGALGAAIGTAGTMIVHNILKQAGLRLASGISLFDKNYSSFYLTIALSAIGLILVRLLSPGRIYALLALAGLASFLVLTLSTKKLRVAETFPELLKLRLMRIIFT
jgi:O-antigen/teichoic acid export membrane protein